MTGSQVDPATLADHLAIRQLRAAYSHAVDDCAWDEWVGLFTPDATCELGFDTLAGIDEIERYARETLAERFAESYHTAQMPHVTVDGDAATGRWYILVYYELPDGATGRLLGRYLDSYRRTPEGWKFDHIDYDVRRDTGPLMDEAGGERQ
jgi:ketosteroid isomerase-like protein